MRFTILIWLLVCACASSQAQVYYITTICGDSVGYSGDGGLAKSARLNIPELINLDKKGDIQIADCYNHCVRKIERSSSIITTIAGGNGEGYSGDGYVATLAKLFLPEAVAMDSRGNVYISDAGNNRIRRIDFVTNVITTIAGSGPTGVTAGDFSGDGGQASSAKMNLPMGLCLDKNDNIYFADYLNDRIRRIDATTGIITTVVGNGSKIYPGDGLTGIKVGISGVLQVFVDSVGNIFYSDQFNNCVRKVDAVSGLVQTVAGNGTKGYSGNGGHATIAQLNEPAGIFMDTSGNIYIADYRNGAIRKVDAASSIITTVAGNGTRGFSGDGGPATNAMMKCTDVRVDKHGSLFIADVDNHRIRMVWDTTLKVQTPNLTAYERDVIIYPNPATNELLLEGTEDCDVAIRNSIGQQVLFFRPSPQKNRTLDVGGLPPGVYLLRVEDASTGYRATKQFVKVE